MLKENPILLVMNIALQLVLTVKIIYFVEMVEGRDKTEKGQDLKKQFEGEMDSNVVVLVARMCFCICGLGRVVVLDLGFGYVSTLVGTLFPSPHVVP